MSTLSRHGMKSKYNNTEHGLHPGTLLRALCASRDGSLTTTPRGGCSSHPWFSEEETGAQRETCKVDSLVSGNIPAAPVSAQCFLIFVHYLQGPALKWHLPQAHGSERCSHRPSKGQKHVGEPVFL